MNEVNNLGGERVTTNYTIYMYNPTGVSQSPTPTQKKSLASTYLLLFRQRVCDYC